MPTVHHSGLYCADLEASLHFYIDGIGLAVLSDTVMKMDMEPLLGVTTTSVRTVFLGDAEAPDSAILELINLGTGQAESEPILSGLPVRGLFLVSFVVPVDATLARLAALGLGGTPRRVPTGRDSWAATVVDPDGSIVELLDRIPQLG